MMGDKNPKKQKKKKQAVDKAGITAAVPMAAPELVLSQKDKKKAKGR